MRKYINIKNYIVNKLIMINIKKYERHRGSRSLTEEKQHIRTKQETRAEQILAALTTLCHLTYFKMFMKHVSI
jgi:hypothetical protein